MRKCKDILRLHAAGFSHRKIAGALGLGRTAVGSLLDRALEADIKWPDCNDSSEVELEARLYPGDPSRRARERPSPDLPLIGREMRRKGVT